MIREGVDGLVDWFYGVAWWHRAHLRRESPTAFIDPGPDAHCHTPLVLLPAAGGAGGVGGVGLPNARCCVSSCGAAAAASGQTLPAGGIGAGTGPIGPLGP